MLKIKDNVDLKELENYGFYEDEDYYVDNMVKFKIGLSFGIPIIDKKTNKEEAERLINIFNILYDFRFAFLNYFLYICTNDLNPTEENIKEYLFNFINKKNMANKENLKVGKGKYNQIKK